MPTATLTPADYSAVVAVPPVALDAEGRVSVAENRRLMEHIVDGGSDVLLYGGNANIYHFGAKLFREALSTLTETCPKGGKILFSIGPDFGKAMDQVPDVRASGLKNVMMLPMAFPSDPRGVAEGARRLADALGFGLVLYVKRDGYVEPEAVARLVEDGAVSFVKYAVERSEAAQDPYLDSLIAAVGAGRIASGMGETPIHDHIGQRELTTFTSGAVCIAPAASNELLRLYRAGQHEEARERGRPFLEFERVRAQLGGTAVLHDAVTLSRIAACGPLTPLVSNLTEEGLASIRPAVEALLAAEAEARQRKLAA